MPTDGAIDMLIVELITFCTDAYQLANKYIPADSKAPPKLLIADPQVQCLEKKLIEEFLHN